MSTTGFRRIGTADTIATGSGILIPRSGTGGGGEYGADITDDLRTFAITREPVAYRLVFTISKIIFDNWFKLEGSNYRTPTQTEQASESPGKPLEAFDRRVQKLLTSVNAKDELTRMAVYERGYGWAIIVLGYHDSAPTLAEPVSGSKQIDEIKAYGPPQITKVVEVTDREDPRFGLPLYYDIRLPGMAGDMRIHYTRVIHFATRLIDHDWKGKSVLDPVWDDLNVLRNIRWGMGQTMYRYGSGFPDITFTGAEKEDIEDWIDTGAFSNLNARTYFAHSEDQVLDFKGLQGRALDPMNYYLPPMEHISCGSGIPLAILRGVQAGALTGSEVNQMEFYSGISTSQSDYEIGIRQLINALTGQETEYTFNWLGGFELDEEKKQNIALARAQELEVLWNFKTRNEIREMIDPELPELSAEEGGDDFKTKSNGPEPELPIDPLTGQPQKIGAPPKKEDLVDKEVASFLVTKVTKQRST